MTKISTSSAGMFQFMGQQLNSNLQARSQLNTDQSPPAGSLIISDKFIPSSSLALPHGESVKLAAMQNGFDGSIVTREYLTQASAASAKAQAVGVLTDPTSRRDDVLQAVSTHTAATAIDFVESQTEAVRRQTQTGARNTALNFSQGVSKAGLSDEIYSNARLAWADDSTPQERKLGRRVAGNLAKAYELDLKRLTSPNLKVAAKERAQLQERLIGHVDHVVEKSPRMQAAKRDWTHEVRRFEANNNSVVIAAGNDALIPHDMAKEAGNESVGRPPDFQTNLIEIPEVTTVGATRWTKNGEQLTESKADYSTRSSGIDIYASGSVDYDSDQRADTMGTSFSAPRVAAVMAKIHKQNPSLSSSQVENLMRNQLTHDLNDAGGGRLKVLDYQRSSDFLVGKRHLE